METRPPTPLHLTDKLAGLIERGHIHNLITSAMLLLKDSGYSGYCRNSEYSDPWEVHYPSQLGSKKRGESGRKYTPSPSRNSSVKKKADVKE